jgi:hypothetical protein
MGRYAYWRVEDYDMEFKFWFAVQSSLSEEKYQCGEMIDPGDGYDGAMGKIKYEEDDYTMEQLKSAFTDDVDFTPPHTMDKKIVDWLATFKIETASDICDMCTDVCNDYNEKFPEDDRDHQEQMADALLAKMIYCSIMIEGECVIDFEY